jgi:hypothetical protein
MSKKPSIRATIVKVVPLKNWGADALANAIDRAFLNAENPTIAEMMAAAKHCEETIPPTSAPNALDECLHQWMAKHGVACAKTD